jgi:hypothetical protein
MPPRRTLLAAVLAAAAVAAGAPAAQATTTQVPAPDGVGVPTGSAVSGCGPASGNQAQGGNLGSEDTICTGSGSIVIGPSLGGIATVTGPVINSPGFAGLVITSSGNSAVAP